MKRFSVVVTGLGLVVLLTACGTDRRSDVDAKTQPSAAESAAAAENSASTAQPAPDTSSAASSAVILTEEDAKNIALTDAGVTEADVTGIRIQLETDHGIQEYEVEFYAGNLEYDYDIDAATGQIRSKDTDIENDFPTIRPSSVTITQADAIALVLEKVPGAVESDVHIHLDHDDGRTAYEGSLVLDQTEYNFEIDAETGRFLEWEQEAVHG